MAVALSHEGSFGFALQSAQGTFIGPTNWVPLSERGGRGPAESITARKNYQPLDLADVRAYQTAYFSAGEWAEGQVRFPLVPGTLTDLFAWIQERDGDNQGKWASAVVDCVHEVKKITDLKVRRATLDLVTGEPVICTLEVTGLKLESGSTPSPVMPTTAPYLYREATVELAVGGTPALDGNCERIRVVIDTCLQAAEEGLRLAPSGAPACLYNLAGVRARGTFSHDFADSGVYQDFLEGAEAALTVTLQRGAASAEISLPRLLYVGNHLGLPGSHERRLVEEVEFLALGSEDGSTAPVILA
jgi:hypothetical protein